MARRSIPAGEIGSIQITRLKGGVYRARARARDDAGKLHQLRAVAGTEAEARAEIQRRADRLGSTSCTGLTRDNTIEEACLAWVESIRVRAQTVSLSYSTFESYEATARLTIVPRCGGITLGALTVGRCDRIIHGILLEQSLLAARRARSVLGLVCGYAVRDDAIPSNPVRDVQRLPQPPKKTSILTPDQVAGVRGLMERWREQGVRRKDSPKRTRQIRRVALPAMAAAAVRRRLALEGKGTDALLFATKNGAPLSVSNYERLLRTFINDNRDALIELGVEVDEYSTHIYRRTVATFVERNAGITLASRLLGHANEQITRASYVVTAEQVDPITVDILDEILGS